MAPKLTRKMRQFGVDQARRRVLPKLAIAVAEAAQRREIGTDDALEIYIEYYRSASTLKTIDPFDNGVKANASKLCQVIKAADPELLRRVTATHNKLILTTEVVPLYAVMVNACRIKNATGKRPTSAQLAALCRRSR